MTIEEEFQHKIAWRKKEIVDINLLVKANPNLPSIHSLGLVCLCAQIEGTLRDCSTTYFAHIGKEKLFYKDLKHVFLAYQLWEDYSRSEKDAKKESVLINRIQKILNLYETKNFKDNIKRSTFLSTHSNPDVNRINIIIFSLGLELEDFQEEFQLRLNQIGELVEKRHKIAHGEKVPVTPKEFEEYFEATQIFLSSFPESLVRAFENKKFKKN